MIETTSRGSFNHDQIKHVQNGGWMRRRGEWPKNPKLGLFLVEIWADKERQRQLSAMGRKHNIWENIAAKLSNSGYKLTASQRKTKIHNLEQKYKKAKNLD